MKKKPKRKSLESCPKCGSLDIVPIVYGEPGPDLIFEVGKGKIVLGGCLVTNGHPRKQCKACGTQFDFQPPQIPRRARRK